MTFINAILNTICDLLLSPFGGESGWPGMIAVSVLPAWFFVWLFRVFSNQRALKRGKARMLGRALELLLFRHDMVVSVTAFSRILAANFGYFKELLKPIAVGVIPGILLLIQLGCWYDYRPFLVGEPVLVTVNFDVDFPVMSEDIRLTSSEGLVAETDGLRVPTLNQISWRFRARDAGSGWVEIETPHGSLRKDIVVDTGVRRLATSRVRAGIWNELTHPSEPPLPAESSVRSMQVRYPPRQLSVAGWDIAWPIAFLLLIMGFGLVFGRLMKVSF